MFKIIKFLVISLVIVLSFLFIKTPNIYAAENKYIEVDLTSQHLYAYDGNKKVYDFLISSGKWYPTPTGTFYPWIKLRFTRMTGGDQNLGTFYDLSNVPFVVFFYNSGYEKAVGYSLHGTYWHNNFGHPMSHGCINLRTDDAEKLYGWIDLQNGNSPGTKITIYGDTPDN